MTCDLHCHSRYSFDGKSTLNEICENAASRHIDIIAPTDHCDMTLGPDGISYYLENESELLKEYNGILERRADSPRMLYGVEIGNAIDMPRETEAFLRHRSFDFIIGSIHFLPDGSDIYKLAYATPEEVDDMFRKYFVSMLELARMGGFDSLAHLDYPLRVLKGKVNAVSVLEYRDLIEPILEEIVKQQIALEISTRGTYDWQRRVSPEKWVVGRFRELGGRHVTIGSDAHSAALIGEGFAQAAELLESCKFDSYTIYCGRKPVQIPLATEMKEDLTSYV